MEIWKNIINYETLYQISNLGNVKRLNTKFIDVLGRQQNVPEKILKQSFDGVGYLQVNLSKNGISKHFAIHRLVAIHFIDNFFNLQYVNHKDKNKINNSITNLEWVSASENLSHAKDKQNTTSKYVGISFNKHRNTWRARITINGKLITIGTFKTEEEANISKTQYLQENNIQNKYM
jgi:hypothetical protein